MIGIGELLAVLASIFQGFYVIAIRRGLARSNFLSATLTVTIIASVIFGSLTVLVVSPISVDILGISLFILAGTISPGISRLLNFKGMEKLGASLNASLLSTWPIFSSIMAILLLDELPTIGIWLSIGFIIGGGILLERSIHSSNLGSGKAVRRSFIYPLFGAVFIGLATVLRKIGLNIYGEPLVGLTAAHLISLCVYVTVIAILKGVRDSVSLNRETFSQFGVAAILMCLGWLCNFYALKFEEVTVVSSLRATQPVFVVFFAYLLLKRLERLSLKLVIGAILTVVGVLVVIMS